MDKIKMIVCVDKNYGLGYENDLLFRNVEDLKHFKTTTNGGVLLLGRKTHESMREGRALPNRTHFVLTRDTSYKSNDNNVFIFNDIETMFNRLKDFSNKPVFVTGGGEIYTLLQDYVSEIIITKVDKEVDKVDTYFDKTILEKFVKYREKEIDTGVVVNYYKR